LLDIQVNGCELDFVLPQQVDELDRLLVLRLVDASLDQRDDLVLLQAVLNLFLGGLLLADVWEHSIELAVLYQLADYVHSAHELAVHEYLGECGPLGVELEPLSDALIRQDVKGLVLVPCLLNNSTSLRVNLHLGYSGVPLMKPKKGHDLTIVSISKKAFFFSRSSCFW